MSGTLAISFNEIPADWRVPGIYVEVTPSFQNVGVLGYQSRALLIGQRTAAGSAPANTPQRVTRREQAAALFGGGSIAAEMAWAFLDANSTTELTVIGMADPGGGVAATGSFTIAGTATAAGSLAIGIGSRRYSVPVAVGATAAAVATALRTAINADPMCPAPATGTAGTVTLTARNTGAIGNAIALRANPLSTDVVPTGLTNTVVAMASGAGVVDITAALSAVAATWYTDIGIAWSDSTNIGVLATELARRYTAMGRLDARGYVGAAGTFGTLTALGAALNSPLMAVIGANGSRSSPWQWAASLTAQAAFFLANDPARQLRSLPLPGIIAPDEASRFLMNEQDSLLRDAISTFDVAPDNTVILQRVISTYQTSALGVADASWLDITTASVMSRIRFDWSSYLSLNYPRSKLADDGSPAAEFGDAVVTPRMLHSSWAARCALYERLGWIEDAKRTVAASTFVRDGSDRNRVNARQQVRVVGNLMVLAASLQFEA